MSKKTRILVATGIYPPDIGGPAKYAKKIADEFALRGISVRVISYGVERRLPIGVRHFFYFLKLIFRIRKVDLIIS